MRLIQQVILGIFLAAGLSAAAAAAPHDFVIDGQTVHLFVAVGDSGRWVCRTDKILIGRILGAGGIAPGAVFRAINPTGYLARLRVKIRALRRRGGKERRIAAIKALRSAFKRAAAECRERDGRPTPTPGITPTETPSPAPSGSPAATPTPEDPEASPTPSPTPTPTATPSPSPTPTPTPPGWIPNPPVGGSSPPTRASFLSA